MWKTPKKNVCISGECVNTCPQHVKFHFLAIWKDYHFERSDQ